MAATASMDGKGWRVRLSSDGVYTGGKVEFFGEVFACMMSENVVVASAKTGRVLFKVRPGVEDLSAESVDNGEDELLEKYSSFCLHPSGKELVTMGKNLLIRRWKFADLLEKKLQEESEETFEMIPDVKSVLLKSSKPEYPETVRSWKAHDSPVTCSDFHPNGEMFVTGSSDRTVKVWNLHGGHCTHNFRSHRAVLTFVKFHPELNQMRLTSGDVSGHVWYWDLVQQTDREIGNEKTSKKQSKSGRNHLHLENHVSAITSILFSKGNILFTTGRDRVINVWLKGQLLRTFPVLESVEGMQRIPLHSLSDITDDAENPNKHFIATAGEKSEIRYWCFHFDKSDGNHRLVPLKTQPSLTAANGIVHPFVGLQTCTLNGIPHLVALRFDNLIQFFDPVTLQRVRQIIGYVDEVVDLKYLEKRTVVMATNSEQATILDLNTSSSELLAGHTGIILSVDVSPDCKFIATSSKDSTFRVWDATTLKCIAIGKGHTEAVSAVNFLQIPNNIFKKYQDLCDRDEEMEQKSKKQKTEGDVSSKLSNAVVASVSEDKTLKFWAIPSKVSNGELVCKKTTLAHEKAINALASAPNKALLATGSLDKLIKLWNPTDFSLRGTLKGHRRGIWHLQFSPVERCLASASGDKTIRIWSIADLSCLTVLEGHSSSVLRVQYNHNGHQLISSASNGVLKVWSLKAGECVSTLEHHTDKVWALAMPPKPETAEEEKELLSGGGDSRLVIWRDCSDELKQVELQKEEENILHEQEMMSSLLSKQYVKAALRALELNRPFQLRTTLEAMVQNPLEGQELSKFISLLDHEQLLTLWELARDWNTYARNSALANLVVQELLAVDIPLGAPGKAKAVLDPFRAYGERHFQRVDRLLRDSYLVDHVVACMDNGLVSEDN